MSISKRFAAFIVFLLIILSYGAEVIAADDPNVKDTAGTVYLCIDVQRLCNEVILDEAGAKTTYKGNNYGLIGEISSIAGNNKSITLRTAQSSITVKCDTSDKDIRDMLSGRSILTSDLVIVLGRITTIKRTKIEIKVDQIVKTNVDHSGELACRSSKNVVTFFADWEKAGYLNFSFLKSPEWEYEVQPYNNKNGNLHIYHLSEEEEIKVYMLEWDDVKDGSIVATVASKGKYLLDKENIAECELHYTNTNGQSYKINGVEFKYFYGADDNKGKYAESFFRRNGNSFIAIVYIYKTPLHAEAATALLSSINM